MSFRYYDWIRHHGNVSAGKTAVIDAATGRRFTYREWNERIGRLAGHLLAKGIGRGDRVATLATNCTDMLEVQFAALRIGAVFLPMNNRLTFPELEFIGSDAGISYLLYTPDFAGLAGELARALPLKGTLAIGPDYEAALRQNEPVLEEVEVPLTELSTIMYTSGTTGRPKGAMITHLMTFINCVNLGLPARITPDSVHLAVVPLFHTGGLNCYCNPILHAGGTAIVMPGFDAALMLRLIGDPALGITHTFGVPSVYQFLAQSPDFETADLSRLVVAGVGGAPLPLEIIRRWQQRGISLVQGYGMTETSPGCICLDASEAERKVGSSGKPLLHAEVKIVGGSGEPVKQGDIGEIWVRGPNISPGYWNRPDANESSFTDGWLHTGDLARQDDEGYYYIVDRAKDMYISGGENVYPAEVEDVLSRHAAIKECAVIGVADERWGETGLAIVALTADDAASEGDLMAHCRQNLAKFKCPARIVFVEALPRNATGKIHKPSLRAEFT